MAAFGIIVLVLGLVALGSGTALKLNLITDLTRLSVLASIAPLTRKHREKAAELSLKAGATALFLGAFLVMAGSV